jgi:hypothetical protein
MSKEEQKQPPKTGVRRSRVAASIVAVLFCVSVVTAVVAYLIIDKADRNARSEVVLEAGNQIRIEDFFEECPEDAAFITDVSGVDVNVPAVYRLKVSYGKVFEKEVTLRIEDHTGPVGEAIPQTQFTLTKWPEASECVGCLYDLSGIATVKYKEELPKRLTTGDYEFVVVVTDWYDNSTEISVPFHVINDQTAPYIKGVHPLTCSGDPDAVDFFEGITVTDDYDETPYFVVDDESVDYSKNGTYEIIYKAIDSVGNIRTVSTTMTVKLSGAKKKTEAGYSGNAYEIAKQIFKDYGMKKGNDVETARAIFNFVNTSIWYQTIRGRQTYEGAAYRGFTRHNGDCYVYYACMRMLLDVAGIPNMAIHRKANKGTIHYWNLVKLNGQWYHCDATRYSHRLNGWFMCTDKQIDDKYHKFNGYDYPERAGGSKEFKPTDTPAPSPTPTSTPAPETSVDPSQTSVTPATTDNPSGATVSPTTVPTTSTDPRITPTVTITSTPVPTKATDDPSPTPKTADPSPTNTPKPADPTPTNTPKPTEPKPTESKPDNPPPANEG